MRDEQATTRLVLITAIAPITWGTTYAVTTELLPPDRPLLAATLRALPAGIALVAVTGCRPPSGWWGRIAVLGTLNVGAFFALLFVAATRLPGGVAAMLGLLSPLVATAVGWLVLHQSLTAGQVAGALLVLVALRVGQGRLRPPAPVPPTPEHRVGGPVLTTNTIN